jgi:Tfp pilus assembly protein PilX
MRKGRGQEGIALIITLLVMTILLIMGSAFMSISSTETLIAINERNRLQAYHLAEAAAERAIAELNADPGYGGTGGAEVALPAPPQAPVGTYTVTVTVTCASGGAPPCPPADPVRRIISTKGCVRNCGPGSAQTRVEMVAERRSQFPFGLLTLNLIELDGDGAQVDSYDSALGDYGGTNTGSAGHVHSNNRILLKSNNIINGNAELGAGAVEYTGAGNVITGGVTTGVSPYSVVTDISYPPPGGYMTGVNPPAAYNGSTYDLTVGANQTVTLSPGTYAFNKITIGANGQLAVSGPVTIYMTGQLLAGTGAVVNTSKLPTNLNIFSSKTGEDAMLFSEGTGEFYGGIYALNGEVEFQNAAGQPVGWKIFGAIVAKEVDIESKARFHYDLALGRASGPAARFGPVVGTWREVFSP